MDWQEAEDVRNDLKHIVATLEFPHIDLNRVHCYRTTGAQTRAYARTWSFPKIFQKALGVEAAYVIEVVSKRYDKLSEDEKKKTLIHELLHIPKNFSGALVPHRTKSRNIYTLTNSLFKEYKQKVNPNIEIRNTKPRQTRLGQTQNTKIQKIKTLLLINN